MLYNVGTDKTTLPLDFKKEKNESQSSILPHESITNMIGNIFILTQTYMNLQFANVI